MNGKDAQKEPAQEDPPVGVGYSVPDHGQEKGRERLTKRERDMIKELAREIVREAGLARDSEKEATEKRRRGFIEGGSRVEPRFSFLCPYSPECGEVGNSPKFGEKGVGRCGAWTLGRAAGVAS